MSKRRRKLSKGTAKGAVARPSLTARQHQLLQDASRAQSQGQIAFAERVYRALIDEKVKVPHPYCNLASICAQTDREEEARKLWSTALSMDPRSVPSALGLASQYERLAQTDKAVEIYQRMLKQNPGHVPARYLLANQFKAMGRFAEAEALYLEIMREQPDYTQAHFNYSGIHRYQEPDEPHIRSMLGLMQSASLPEDKRIHLAFALAKAYEDLGDFAQAFQFLKMGNLLRHEGFRYTIDSDEALVDNIIHTFNADDLAQLQVSGSDSDRPIFIVGMVRSGTSLVEKILSSHASVYGAGELEYIFALGKRLFMDPARHSHFRPLPSYPAATFGAFSRSYLSRLDAHDNQAPHVTDKMPFNMMMLGLIRVAFPNAKIVHCVRDARDTCLSIYRQNFASGNYRFAYDLESTGRFHNLYRRLMKHWHEVFPGAIYDIQYEALTENPEPEISKLLSACDLEWQDECLRFYRTRGIVKTASFYQVRQPMYTSSVGFWRNYRKYLKPLFDVLEAD